VKYLALVIALVAVMSFWHNLTKSERRYLWVSCRPYLFYATVSLLAVGVVIQLATSGQQIRVM
jgi:hypothetical protein